jgi:transposase
MIGNKYSQGADYINQGKQDRLAAIGAAQGDRRSMKSESQRHELLEMWEDDHVSNAD